MTREEGFVMRKRVRLPEICDFLMHTDSFVMRVGLHEAWIGGFVSHQRCFVTQGAVLLAREATRVRQRQVRMRRTRLPNDACRLAALRDGGLCLAAALPRGGS